MARTHDYSYLRTTAEVKRFVSLGLLVEVRADRDIELKEVSYPYARPQLKLFIQRLAGQYRRACGEKLVVTSLTRPTSRQPRNASQESVHPTGMAADIRRSNNMTCRSWIERVLLDLEESGVLEATRERRPPHFHVAIFPDPYEEYVRQHGVDVARVASAEGGTYRVRSGDSLWTIARKHGTTVERLKQENGLRSSRIYTGQILAVPGSR